MARGSGLRRFVPPRCGGRTRNADPRPSGDASSAGAATRARDKTRPPPPKPMGAEPPKEHPGGKTILMSQQDDFERILASLYEATLDDLHWDKTSALIDEACGARGNSVVFAGMTPAGAAEILFARICHRGQRDREFEQEYVRVHYPVDERLPRFRQLPDSKIVHVTELLSEQELKKSRLYNEILPRRQSQDSLYTRMDGPFGSRIGWVIGNPVDARGCTPSLAAPEQSERATRRTGRLAHRPGDRRSGQGRGMVLGPDQYDQAAPSTSAAVREDPARTG